MIIKSMSRKSSHVFGQLVRYFRRDEKCCDLSAARGFNLLVDLDDLEAVAGEFRENYHEHSLKNSGHVVAYHEVLAPLPEDAGRITPEVLYDLGACYLENRAPDALAFMQVHEDIRGERRPHLHLLISGNLIASPRQVRIGKERFAQVKQAVRKYARARYPELKLVCDFEKGAAKARGKDVEIQVKNRGGELTRKEKVRVMYRESLARARDPQHLEKLLRACGYECYVRGNTPGIIGPDGEKYRLKTLGVLADLERKRLEWALESDRQSELEHRRQMLARLRQSQKEREKEMER